MYINKIIFNIKYKNIVLLLNIHIIINHEYFNEK